MMVLPTIPAEPVTRTFLPFHASALGAALFVVAAIWYLVFTSLISIVQRFVERHYNRGQVRR